MPYALITLGSLVTRLRQRTDGPNVFWPEEECLLAVSEAVRVWQALTAQTTLDEVVVDAQVGEGLGGLFPVPRQLAIVQRVKVRHADEKASNFQQLSPLTLLSLVELDRAYPGWGGVDTGSGHAEYWAPVGSTFIAIYPAPVKEEAIQLSGVMDVGPLNLGSVLALGNEDITHILAYAVHYLSLKEGSPEAEASAGGLQRMVEGAAKRNRKLLSTNFYRRFASLDKDTFLNSNMLGEDKVGAFS